MKPNPIMTVVAGLLATPAMTVLIYVLAPILGVRMDVVAMLGEILGGWKMGMLVHILNDAIIFPLVYTFLLYRFLPGRPAAKGVSFGVLLWLTSQVVVMPLMGAGFFSSQIGGMKATALMLLGHIVYGGFLGLFPTLVQEDFLRWNRLSG
jgi:uncharacterized membrane protein YagU involved in acid resistance